MLRFRPATALRLAPLAALTLTLSCCVAPEREPAPEPAPAATAPAPEPVSSPTPTPKPTGEWTEWTATPGQWIYRRDDRGTLALFGEPNRDALLTLRCELPARRMFLTRAGSASAPTPLTIRTTGGVPPYVGIALSPTDMILDRMIYSRGRFLVEGGGAPLIVPSWPEIARVVEDCRA